MYDNVNFWADRIELSGSNPFDILPCLSELTEWKKGQIYSASGKVKNYSVNVYENGISLQGSLAKFHLGNNIETLNRHTAKTAITELSDCLHLDINAAKVTRLDISTVIPTNQPPQNYYTFLGSKPYFTRLQSTADTLYYNNHQRQIIFYDKIKEAHNGNISMPEIFKNNNLLRYELRYTKRLNKQMKQCVTAETLTDKDFYNSIIKSWHNEFKTIQKIKNTGFMIDNITTPKEAIEALFATLLQQSGQSTINDFLNELKANNKFNNRSDYTKLKAKLNRLMQTQKGIQSDLMQELEKKIYQAAKYAL